MICHSQINSMEYFAIINSFVYVLCAMDQNASLNIDWLQVYLLHYYTATALNYRFICHKTNLLNFCGFFYEKKFGLNLTAFYFHIRFERWNIYRISIHYSVCVGTTFAYKSPTKICGQMFCINSCANDKRTSSFNETENPKWNWCKIHATGAQNISRMKWIKVDGVCGTRFGFLVIYKFLVRLVCDMLLLLSVAAYLNTAMKFP